jgi:hypothetical protein
MGTKHGKLMRGLKAAGESAKTQKSPFGARFGRLFPKSHGAKFSSASLHALANAMISAFDPPKDAPDDEESGIPSLYTYFGQFIDHDLTFDPDSSFQKFKDPTATEDFRTPAFDLDNVYGRGPGDQPYMYTPDGLSFQLGDPITQGSKGARDLQRNANGRALIGDPRNDENSIVSQLQGLWLRFHNRLVREEIKKGRKPDFEAVQKQVRKTYQYLVINDFLARIVSAEVLKKYQNNRGLYDRSKLKVFKGFKVPFMPVEFSVGAYRLGHSMIRPGYRLNDTVLVPIFPLPRSTAPGFPEGLTGFRRLISDWAIDWGRFIDIDTRDYGSATGTTTADLKQNFKRLQFAYRIDTALVRPLKHLPTSVAANPASLALRNLERGVEFGLPSGQKAAQLLKLKKSDVLADDKILIGQGVDKPDPGSLVPITAVHPGFKGKCPLWTYILAEAIQHKQDVKIPVKQDIRISTPQLGPVGGSIVAEVFLGLMFADPYSYLSHQKREPGWTPNGKKQYRLKDFVKFALG